VRVAAACRPRSLIRLPEGVSLDEDDCNLRGVATSGGTFFGSVTLRVDDFDGTLNAGYRFDILAPKLSWVGEPGPRVLNVGASVDSAPWLAEVAQIDYYSYRLPEDRITLRVAQGSLPQGISLTQTDSGLVLLSGTPTTVGDHDVVLEMTLQRKGHTLKSELPLSLQAKLPVLFADYGPCCEADVGVPLRFTPATSYDGVPGASLSFELTSALRPGLSLDPATGAIYGTPSTTDWRPGTNGVVRATLNGVVVAEQGFYVQITPRGVYALYPQASSGELAEYADGRYPPSRIVYWMSAGVPFTIAPGSVYGSRDGDSYRYRLLPSSQVTAPPLPGWVAVDPVTGVISGTRPAGVESGQFEVELTVTRGGASYRVNQSWSIN
jgi:hypothetical protein